MSSPRTPRPPRPSGTGTSTVRAGRRRADRAKLAVLLITPIVFAAGLGLARRSYASHPRHPARALAVPPRFERVVRENLLQAGVLAPQQAPPAVRTASS